MIFSRHSRQLRRRESIILQSLLFFVLLTVLLSVQIVNRYILGSSIVWLEEIARVCFVWTEVGPAEVEIVDYHR